MIKIGTTNFKNYVCRKMRNVRNKKVKVITDVTKLCWNNYTKKGEKEKIDRSLICLL